MSFFIIKTGFFHNKMSTDLGIFFEGTCQPPPPPWLEGTYFGRAYQEWNDICVLKTIECLITVQYQTNLHFRLSDRWHRTKLAVVTVVSSVVLIHCVSISCSTFEFTDLPGKIHGLSTWYGVHCHHCTWTVNVDDMLGQSSLKRWWCLFSVTRSLWLWASTVPQVTVQNTCKNQPRRLLSNLPW